MENVTVIKIGGDLANNEVLLKKLALDILELKAESTCLLIHGGGGEVTALERRLGMEPVFDGGQRMTTWQEMILVEEVLSGRINKRLVRVFQSSGLNAVGLCGADGRLFIGKSVSEGVRTGEITSCDLRFLELLLTEGYFPIISSTAMDGEGAALNINADSVGFFLAGAMKARDLIFLSDIPGIMKQGKVLPSLLASEVVKEIERGTITKGMIPKVQASVAALERGVANILIGCYEGTGSLTSLLGRRSGTQIAERSNYE